MTPADIEKLPYRPCVGIVLARDGKVFAAQRLDAPAENPAWQMPQGGIDEGEDPRTAALRELREETGVVPKLVEVIAETRDWIPYDLPHDLVPKLWRGRFRGQEQKWFLMHFTGQDSDINIDTEIPEFSRWQWMKPGEMIDRIVPFKRDTYTRVFEAFGGQI